MKHRDLLVAVTLILSIYTIGIVLNFMPSRGEDAFKVAASTPGMATSSPLNSRTKSASAILRGRSAPVTRQDEPKQAIEDLWLIESEVERNDAMEQLVSQLNEEEARDFIRQIQALEASPLIRDEVLFSFARAWSRTNPAAAVEWARGLPEFQRDSMLDRVCYEMAYVDPLAALDAVRLNDGSTRTPGMIATIVQAWATQDAQAALDWSIGMPPGDERDQVIARMAYIQSKTDPQEAAVLVFSEMLPGTNQDKAVMAVLHQWGLKDLQSAREWVEKFPIPRFDPEPYRNWRG